MFLKPYARSLAIAASLAVLAGCSSTGGTQDGSAAGTGTGGTMGGTGVGTGTAGSGQVSGSGYGTDGAGQMADGRIPEVRTIYFNYDSDAIRPEFESVVNAHAQYLSSNPNASVVLQGHTDERGTREYNLALGERRAGSVERYLRLQGVNPSQMEVVSYGEERPAARGSNEDAFAQNRRVVFAY
ncbi:MULTISPECIES: peptidoglycan-associated lipoprotein Pal [Halomonas]|uniref:Peptidoglycan-associated lipoprotein n=3 Tax=Halomonas TaxID=2745 RepID=A0AAU7KPL6_9GAMM|nr:MULTISPECIES: peptidoglycan-associated lipoprotein Pal [Halomonas]MBR9770609.1 peptidoglycan-associated lipoprotein Pal [Gammaproteobacteria bacterium]HAR06837.1 peptidoglycan-associated lipoprotein Pal [Cobetia sp.]KJZ16849.1 flagellar motor protein MotB [Halomonas sp. S2151]MAR71366.1 peptidoglycan-associated lipoprotein [Halomonas sp.]MAY69880.1 peptidoglycan-associated lipoprotein [Halomonas sp.]|tara:strand:+ start:492 stop:1043 length:552 start_codon:yes stop_codon:yes gene_type:complete